MPVSLTVYDGANTIGGNKILLEDGATAVFLDFGTSFSSRRSKRPVAFIQTILSW